jgi:phage regulator Rha-like protein
MISAEDMFERIDHWANNAMPITARTEVKSQKFCLFNSQIAIIIVMSIKTTKLMNFKIGLILYFE